MAQCSVSDHFGRAVIRCDRTYCTLVELLGSTKEGKAVVGERFDQGRSETMEGGRNGKYMGEGGNGATQILAQHFLILLTPFSYQI